MARQGRSQSCSPRDARIRRSHARKFLEVAEIAAEERDQDPEYASVATSLAVLAGIAAADAACCKALGERCRSDDHHQAERFLQRIAGGKTAARHLRDLVDLKDAAHYGFIDVSRPELRKALRRARAMLDFANEVLDR